MYSFRTKAMLSVATAAALLVTGCGVKKEVKLEGSRDVVLSVTLDLTAITAEFESRLPDQKKQDPKYKQAVGQLAKLGIGRVEFYLKRDGAGDVQPVIVLDDPEQKLLDVLVTDPEFSDYFSKDADGAVRPKTDVVPDEVPLADQVQELKLVSLGKSVVCSTPDILAELQQNNSAFEEAFVNRLAARADAGSNLVTLALLVPDELPTTLPEGIEGNSAIQANRMAKMISGMAGDLLAELNESLKSTEGFAVGFAFNGAGGRQLTLAHYFKEAAAAERVSSALRDPAAAADKVDGILQSIVNVMEDESLDKSINLRGRLVESKLSWQADADQVIGQQLVQATLGYLFSQSVASSLKPTEGPIETRYIAATKLKSKVDTKAVEKILMQRLPRSVFPNWYFNSGNDPTMTLVVDPIQIPNAELSKVEYEVLAVSDTRGKDIRRATPNQMLNEVDLSGRSNQIQLAIAAGTPDEKLGKAKIRFTASVPEAVEVFTFRAEDNERSATQNGVTVTVELMEKDVVAVRCRGTRHGIKMFAYDKSGGALARGMSMGGASSASAQFQGVIDRLDVAVPRSIKKIVTEVDVDLNRGKKPELPKVASANVPLRYDVPNTKKYETVDEKDLADLTATWVTKQENEWMQGVRVEIPESVAHFRGKWELHWFDGQTPVLLAGNGMSTGRHFMWSPNEGFQNAIAVIGKLSLDISSDFETPKFKKSKDGQWQNHTYPSGGKLRVRLNRNELTYASEGGDVLEIRAQDDTGQQLKQGDWQSGGKEGTHLFFWGQPTQVEFVVSTRKINKTVPVDIVMQRDGFDDQEYEAYKQQIAQQRIVFKAVQAIGTAYREQRLGYGDDVAGLHFLHGKDGMPSKKIAREIAVACQEGAQRFGYDHQPYHGYTFSFLQKMNSASGPTPLNRRGREKEYAWDGGVLQVKPVNQMPPVVALPVDPGQPVFYMHWGNIYIKQLPEGEQLEAAPETPWQEGWAEASFID